MTSLRAGSRLGTICARCNTRVAKPPGREARWAGLGAANGIKLRSGKGEMNFNELQALSSPSPAHLTPRPRGFATRVSHLAHILRKREPARGLLDDVMFKL